MVRFSCFNTHIHTHKTKVVIHTSCHPSHDMMRKQSDGFYENLNRIDVKDDYLDMLPLDAGCSSADDAANNDYVRKCWSLNGELEQIAVVSGGSSVIEEQVRENFEPCNGIDYTKDCVTSELGEVNEPLHNDNMPIYEEDVSLDDQNGALDHQNGALYEANQSLDDPIRSLDEEYGRLDEADQPIELDGPKSQRGHSKLNRTEQWVSDLQHCSSFEDTDESVSDIDHGKSRFTEWKSIPALDAVKNYISSLSSTSTTAQLANYGLVMVPFLSPFGGLKALNLSGNSIVKISSGVFPRGLHVLNLSKNNITTIEGFRELTRLRVLDLSYNRIFKIGHGLASCSSSKELYLAGNKINEVEGLHRLLKLHILDLRFNKISTAKCLGQLAANYNSLQAISLEGNPAQKNVGDDQLKKHLQGLLPNLVYYNGYPIRSSSLLKEGTDRSARLGISPGTLDRGVKGIQKAPRKPVDSPRRGRGRLPPVGGYPHQQQQYVDLGTRAPGPSGLSMRRSRSEGTLGAF